MGSRGARSSAKSVIIKKEGKTKPENYRTIAKVDKTKLENYELVDDMLSEKIVLTNERKAHLLEDHPDDFDRIMKELDETIKEPDEIRVGKKDNTELHYIRQLESDNQISVVKVQIDKEDTKHKENSIISSWIVNNKNLKRKNKKTTNIYKK